MQLSPQAVLLLKLILNLNSNSFPQILLYYGVNVNVLSRKDALHRLSLPQHGDVASR